MFAWEPSARETVALSMSSVLRNVHVYLLVQKILPGPSLILPSPIPPKDARPQRWAPKRASPYQPTMQYESQLLDIDHPAPVPTTHRFCRKSKKESGFASRRKAMDHPCRPPRIEDFLLTDFLIRISLYCLPITSFELLCFISLPIFNLG